MLATASKPIIARLAAWLAVAMLFAQSLPANDCGCSSGVSSTNSCCSATDQQAQKTCCSTKSKRVASHSVSGSSSCCKSKDRRAATSSSCCSRNGDSSSEIAGTSCHCGASCRCGMEEDSDPPVQTPGPIEESQVDRIELVESTPSTDLLIESHASSLSSELQAERSGPTTALARCIMLSRFTC